ncbi:MAG: hypothetical protein WCA08_23055 [Desulfoferrobacter sp.]
MTEVMYSLNSLFIAGALFGSLIVAIEVGYRIGQFNHGSASDSSKTHVNAIQASLLGLVALLLGFTFSLALQRFDSRSKAVLDEANAIGTTYLRAQLLPTSVRSKVSKLLQGYVDLRVRAGMIPLDDEAERQEELAKANEVLDDIWIYAQQAAEEDKNPVTSGLFIQALNGAIDSYGRRDEELNRHVPEVILFLLFGTFLTACAVIGYCAGFANHRPSVVTYVLIALIVILTFIIVDLDRPRRGMIKVDQRNLMELKVAIDVAQSVGKQSAVPAKLPRPAVTGRP